MIVDRLIEAIEDRENPTARGWIPAWNTCQSALPLNSIPVTWWALQARSWPITRRWWTD